MATLLWERVHEDFGDGKRHDEGWENGSKIMRAMVPGGWLVRAWEAGKRTVGFIFLEDPEHTWE